MKTKVYFHWKNLGKALLILFLLGAAFWLFLTKYEIPPNIATIIGTVIGGGTAIICSNHWTMWHFEATD